MNKRTIPNIVLNATTVYKKLSELTTSGQTLNIKVKLIRMWDLINPLTDDLTSIDIILMNSNRWFLTYLTMDLFYCLYCY
jgi:hypothetical protein